MEQALDLHRPTPCNGQEKLFDQTTESFMARWIAAQNCNACPIRQVCGETAEAGNEIGVWGGRFSPDGFTWHDVKPVRQSNLTKSLNIAIGNRKGLAMVNAAEKILPGLHDLLTNERGQLAYSTKGQCIIRNSRRITTPDGRRESIRHYIMTTLMCVDMGGGRGSVHVSCSTRDCISPWHLRWTRGGGAPSTARSVALALFLFAERSEWSMESVASVTSLHRRDLALLREVAKALGDINPLPDPVLPLMSAAFVEATGRPPVAHEMTALIRICSSADLLDCQTLKDLIDVGETEF
jgi:hypothetical protein